MDDLMADLQKLDAGGVSGGPGAPSGGVMPPAMPDPNMDFNQMMSGLPPGGGMAPKMSPSYQPSAQIP